MPTVSSRNSMKRAAGASSESSLAKRKAKSTTVQDIFAFAAEAVRNHYIYLSGDLVELDQQGVMETVLWPVISEDDPNNPVNHVLRDKACQALAVLLAFRHREGKVSGQALDFALQGQDAAEHWKLCAQYILGQTVRMKGAELDWMTVQAHFASITWAVGLSSTIVIEGVESHLAQPTLWYWMPPRHRELIVRQQNLKLSFDEKPEDKPLLVRLIQKVLMISEGEALFQRTQQQQADGGDEASEAEKSHLREWIFIHRTLELMIDLLSTHKGRQYLVPYLDSIHFSIRLRSCVKSTAYSTSSEEILLAQQLLDRVDRLTTWPEPSVADQRSEYHRRAVALQKMCYRYYPEKLPDVVFTAAGVLCSGSLDYLREAFGGIEDNDFIDLLHRMRLLDKNNGGQEKYNREYLFGVLKGYLTLPANPLAELQSKPLYPTEIVLWDFARIPPSHSSLLPPSHVLSLPKLQPRFLSFSDYLWRNFELVGLESAYEIRSDLVDVIRRLRPLLRQVQEIDDSGNERITLKTEFSGWARMALELQGSLDIIKVSKPALGTNHPSQVLAQITIDLGPCGDAIRREWDELGEFDNIFLVAIDASKMTGEQSPLIRDFHLQHGTHHRWDTDGDRRVPDDDDRTFRERFGVTLVRGCMVVSVKDEEGNLISDVGVVNAIGTKRVYTVALDPAQYAIDLRSPQGTAIFQGVNLVVRRQGKENNFKSVLETIRGLMVGGGSIRQCIPTWLQPVLLGHGDPEQAFYKSKTVQSYAKQTVGVANPDTFLDFGDTFLDVSHLAASFIGIPVEIDGKPLEQMNLDETSRKHYRLRMITAGQQEKILAESYVVDGAGEGNSVRFTPNQVAAIRSGLSCGLTMVVGPPGTGKTDVAVQIIASLYHSFPTQRIIVITHSNAALNDIFEKVMARRDIDERYLLRLGAGERELHTESTHDFTKVGRVGYSFSRRGQLLEEVQLLSESLGLSGKAERGADGSPSYTCETAAYFYVDHVQKRVAEFKKAAEKCETSEIAALFPFKQYFRVEEGSGMSSSDVEEKFSALNDIFSELEEYRPLEILRTQRQRADYLIMKQARVVAMTCTHAAIARSHLLDLGFEYDNVVIEEAGQMLEIETFIPLLLQQAKIGESTGVTRLKRICLMGDHNQLPPVIKNMSFANYSNLDQSMFSRLIRLGVPYIQLDKQGRARSEIADLYRWRYKNLGDLDHVSGSSAMLKANSGFVHTFQIVNVDAFEGKGETTPTAFYYQNLGEAEYAVALFQFMVLIGYSPLAISILTTYNGQRALISDILGQRCGRGTPLAGVRPRVVSTVDQYQGQQNDFIILSLVRTESIGHLRDVRRLVVAVSRARLGLFCLCRQELFSANHDLKPTFDLFSKRPNKLQLVLGETVPSERLVSENITKEKVLEVDDVVHMGSIVHEMQEQWLASQNDEQ